MNLGQLIDQFDLVTDTEEGLEQFRKLILNLAVRGELTKRKNFETDASKLVEYAIEEKQELYQEGEIRKPKEFDDVTSDEVSFQIPEDWEWCRLCDISIIETGKRMKGGARDEGVISLGGEHLNPDGTIDYSIPRCVTEEYYESLNRGKIEIGDTLIVKDGATTGKTAFVESLPESGKASINSHVVLVRALSTVDNYFLFRFIQILSEEFARKHSKGVIGGVKMGQLRSFPVPLPPLEEQKRIAQKIETLFEQVEELEQKVQQDRQVDERLQVAVLDDLQSSETPKASKKSWQRLTDHFERIYRKPEHIDQLKQAILNEAVRGRLIPQDPNDESAEKLLERIKEEKQRLYDEGEIRKPKDLDPIFKDEIPYELPESWCWARMGDSLLKITDGTHKSPSNGPEGDYKYVTAKNIKEDGVRLDNITYVDKDDHEKIYSRCDPEFGDVLYIKDGATTGIATINNLEEPFSMLSSVALLKPNDDIFNKYLLYALRSPFFYNQMRDEMHGAAITRVTLTKLNKAVLPIPPLEQQHKIASKVERLMNWCDNLKDKLSRSQQTDQRLLEALVNGKD